MNSSSRTPPLLSLHGVSKRFGSVAALVDVELEFNSGEIHAVLGENGAGKSTLMNALYGLVPIDAGVIRLHGEPVHFRSPIDARRAGIGMVHQEFALVDALSVAENLTLSLSPPGAFLWARDAVAVTATRMASEIGLELANLNAQVATLPVGARQRIEILKALAGGSRILILDEPTAVLTPGETAQLFGVLRRLRRGGTAVLFITHKLREVTDIADRVTVMRGGRIVAHARRQDVSEADLSQLMVGTLPHSSRQRQRVAAHHIPRLRIDQLSVVDERGVPALRELTLAVRPGEVFGVAGVDGNGQWELFETLTGLRRPALGRIAVDGKPLVEFDPAAMIAAGIGNIPPDRHRQGAVLAMSVQENAVLNSVILRRSARGPFLHQRANRRFAEGLIDRYAIRAESLEAPVSTLSGGNLQRLIAARALALEPKVLVAFNPTRGLDIAGAQAVYAALDTALRRGTAALLISTDLDEILTLSDRIAVLYRGQLSETLHPPFAPEHLGAMLAGSGLAPT